VQISPQSINIEKDCSSQASFGKFAILGLAKALH